MSQQTRAEAVGPYLEVFLRLFPDPAALAAAPRPDVLRAWQGLGYYRRAVHLQQAAVQIMDRHAGLVPRDVAQLRALAGVGPYVAGAVASLAFGLDEPAVDANVTRVLVRLFDIRAAVDDPAVVRDVAALARRLVPPGAAATWNEALMDLGALVCLARAPRCALCPVAPHCRALRSGRAAGLPVRKGRRPRPEVPVVVVLARTSDGRLAVRERPSGGLLGGLWEFPTVEGGDAPALVAAAFGLRFSEVLPRPPFRHVFTHRVWVVHPYEARDVEAAAPPAPPARDAPVPAAVMVGAARPPAGGTLHWVSPVDLAGLPLAGPAARIAAGAGLLFSK